MKPIPVIDIFAGPGGLGEGFSSLEAGKAFEIRLSIEKDPQAHRTLELRALFRQFSRGTQQEYYQYLRGAITREELFEKHRDCVAKARREVLEQPRELGNLCDDKVIRAAVSEVKAKVKGGPSVLIGGPPCQAYSLAGRSRRAREDRATFEQDEKHFLYREYLEIVRLLLPSVFVMENVKGLLSATVENQRMFSLIRKDLRAAGYRLYSLSNPVSGNDPDPDPRAFIVKAEEYGVPQRRHRIIILGVRHDISAEPRLLIRKPLVTVDDAIGDLPRIRGHFSGRGKADGQPDCLERWRDYLQGNVKLSWFPPGVRQTVREFLADLGKNVGASGEFLLRGSLRLPESTLMKWLHDPDLPVVVHHAGRSHLPKDLLRYFYVSAMGATTGRSPKLDEFPAELLPEHANAVQDGRDIPHADRFKVQNRDEPSGTVTCHISKDGHYYIHPDPTQCRSLTVREAARLQTFPDNYFFEGPRTEQYKQVGNAVPPFLAKQIAEIVADILA